MSEKHPDVSVPLLSWRVTVGVRVIKGSDSNVKKKKIGSFSWACEQSLSPKSNLLLTSIIWSGIKHLSRKKTKIRGFQETRTVPVQYWV